MSGDGNDGALDQGRTFSMLAVIVPCSEQMFCAYESGQEHHREAQVSSDFQPSLRNYGALGLWAVRCNEACNGGARGRPLYAWIPLSALISYLNRRKQPHRCKLGSPKCTQDPLKVKLKVPSRVFFWTHLAQEI